MAKEMANPEDFSPDQIRVLVMLERTGGIVSIVAVLCIFVAYALFPKVRNVQNTFIVFASVSNVGASAASIIAFNGLLEGTNSVLCKSQSFLFEMFMQSDPWWSLAMAINVLLVFYFRATPDSFARWWWVYCIICYGGPFIIAITLLLSKSPNKGPIYGEATIWCWVDSQWDDIRIYTYYMLIWICIVGSLLCYALVGYHVFRSRDRLRSLTTSTSRDPAAVESTRNDDDDDGCYGTVVTEVQITSSVGTPRSPGTSATRPQPAHINTEIPAQSVFEHSPTHVPSGFAQYFSSVESPSRRHLTARPWPLRRAMSSIKSGARRFVVADPVKRAYLRTSFLFAISVLVTWIPSSMNRIHSWIDGQSPYEYHVATAAVLPLQGLWNSIIFFVTSWNVFQRHRRNTAASAAAAEAIDRLRQDSAHRTAARASCGNGDGRHYESHSETDLGDGDSRTISSEIELQRRSKSQGTSTPSVV